MLTDKHALRLLAQYMNSLSDLDGAIEAKTWMHVAPLLKSMQIVGQRHVDVAPIRSGHATIYWITNCCLLRHFSLFDQSSSLSIEGDFFCLDCLERVFAQLRSWNNLTELRLQVNSWLHGDVVALIEDMWQGYTQLTVIKIGDVFVQQQAEERIVAAFGNLRVFEHSFRLPRNMR